MTTRTAERSISPELELTLAKALNDDLSKQLFAAIRIICSYEVTVEALLEPEVFRSGPTLDVVHSARSLVEGSRQWRVAG